MKNKKTQKAQFGILAMRYYPDYCYTYATRMLRQEIILTRGLHPALEAAGYKPTQRRLTPRQLKILEQFLGPP